MEQISSSPKYDVFRDGKWVVKTPKTESAEADLARSVVWCQSIGEMVEEDSGLVVPKAEVIEGGARFEWVTGESLRDEDLGGLLPTVVLALNELLKLRVEWSGSADDWMESRLASLAWPEELAMSPDNLETPKLQAGVVHGDFAPKNMIVTAEGRAALIDAEFGTHPKRPGYAMPRMHDAAYFYHLLVCQYQNEGWAEEYLDKLNQVGILGKDQDNLEFWTSVVERTLAMYRNFVLQPKAGFEVDERRKDPEPYYFLLDRCGSSLKKLSL